MPSVTQNPAPVQTTSPLDDPDYLSWLDALNAGHYPDEPPTEEVGWEPEPDDWAWLADDDYGDDEDFSDVRESFRTLEEWDDLPTLSPEDKDRIEDWVMAHTEDLDARREWQRGGGGR